jgi:hypothetical protein
MTLIRTRFLALASFALLFVFFSAKIAAQNMTSTPYSMFGIGQIDMGEYGRSAGMAGTGIGLRFDNVLNMNNPASLSAIDSMRFIFDFTTEGKYSQFLSQGSTKNIMNANYRRLAAGFRFSPRWATSVGILPFSVVGYNIVSTQQKEGTTSTVDVTDEGSGGISKLYWANSFKLTNAFTIGINTSLFFGNIVRKQTVETWTISKQSRTYSSYFDFGAQYAGKFGKDWKYAVGAIYGYSAKLPMTDSLHITTSSQLINETFTSTTRQYIPEFYGVGISLCKNEKLTLAADYKFQKWSKLSTNNSSSCRFADVHRFSIGLDYLPEPRIATSYFQRVNYQFGFTTSNSYIETAVIHPRDYAVTFGMGLPIMNGSKINCAFEFGTTGSTQNGMIRENYGKIILNFNIMEGWFYHRKIN